jgi:hypothetical protein
MTPYSQSNWLQAVRIYVGTLVLLHFVWEMLQLPLYAVWSNGSYQEIAFAVLHCTAGDLMIASLSLLIALLVVGKFAWPSERFVTVMVTTLGLGVGYTVYSEWMNTTVRKTWEYSNLMPTIPLLGTGLSPLMQWLVVPTTGFLAIRRRYWRN